MEDLQSKIEQIIQNILPESFWYSVTIRKNAFVGEYVAIKMAAKDFRINDVAEQRPQAVSLRLDSDMTLAIQSYGCTGGQRIYLVPEKGSYFAMQGVKVPFRKPKRAEKNVLNAIAKFTERYIETLKVNKERLMYKDIVDYSVLE